VTVPPLAFEGALDRARLCRERHDRLVDALREQHLDVLLLLGQANVLYATGVRQPSRDQSEALHRRATAIVTADGAPPTVWTWVPDDVPDALGSDVRAGLELEWEEGAGQLAASLPAGRLAADDLTMPCWRALAAREPADASGVLTAAKIVKTADELECIRRAQAINEAAIADVEPLAAPGVPATEITGHFLRRILALGASGNTVDPVWQIMPRSIADGPYTVTGDVVFPTVTTDRCFAAGDVVFVDTGMHYEGYQSDYGHTWVIGGDIDDRHREHARRWVDTVDAVLEVVKPGVTARDLTRAAGEVYGRRPWLAHLYLAHGTGTDSAEMPYVGTDLGDDFDGSVVLAPGMVLVLEPVIWEDGRCGFRAEDIVAVTDDGFEQLSHLSFEAYGIGR
jgi:Xaa-Pro aminopeptidase